MKYNFTSGAELLEKCKELNMTIHELCIEREAELTGISKKEVRDKMRVSLNIMKNAVEKVVREDIKSMEKWPSKDCITIVDDIIIIKLGAEGE